MSKKHNQNEQANGLLKLLQEHSKGAVIAEGSIKLHKVIEAVKATGKKGALVIKLEFSPVAKSNGEQVVISHEINPKIPEKTTNSSIFFTTEDGGLSRLPQNQMDWVAEQQHREEASQIAREQADEPARKQG